MDHDFWQTRWRENRIAFHEAKPNDLLKQHMPRLMLKPADCVFVPLCGKSFDLDWLLAHGFHVTGAELNEKAVEEVFDRLSLAPERTTLGAITCYKASDLTLFVGDFFQLAAKDVGPVHAVYDRAALVAMPHTMRANYTHHLASITGACQQLIIAYDYDQTQMTGPPFSVPGITIAGYYEDQFKQVLLSDEPISGQLSQRCSGREQAWLMTPMAEQD